MSGTIAVLTVRGHNGGTTAVVPDATAAEQVLRDVARKHGVDQSMHRTARGLIQALAVKGTAVQLRGAQWQMKSEKG